jgi:hypothetical protein
LREDIHESFTRFFIGYDVREGYSYRLSDVLGFKSTVEAITICDFNATMLHLMSLHHERLTLQHNGLRLTSSHAGVIKQVMA